MISRRALVGAGLTAPLTVRSARTQPSPPRVAALDWGLAATVAALGAGPAAVGECGAYRRWVGEPGLPADVIELGLRTNPSFETLAALRPDLILINALNESLRGRLAIVAPVYAEAIYGEDRAPVAKSIAVARDLGARLGRGPQAAAWVAATVDRFEAVRARLRGGPRRAVVPMSFVDARHARFYGAGSLFADVMARVGLTAGWSAPTNAWGFSLAGIDALAACRDVDLLVVEPIPDEARHKMSEAGLWRALVEASGARVVVAPPIWAFGDLGAAARCADVLADLLAPPA